MCFVVVSETQARELAGLDRRTDQRGRADRGANETAPPRRQDHRGGQRQWQRRRQVEQLARLQQLRHTVRVGRPQVVGRGVVALVGGVGGRDHGGGGGREQWRRWCHWRSSRRRARFRGVRRRLQQSQFEHVVRRGQPAHVLPEFGIGLRVGLVPAVPVVVVQQ